MSFGHLHTAGSGHRGGLSAERSSFTDLMSMPGEINTSLGLYNCNLQWTNPLFNIMVTLAMGELCAPPTAVDGAA